MNRRRNSAGLFTPFGNTVGNRISSTRMKRMLGGPLAAASVRSGWDSARLKPPADAALRKPRRSMMLPFDSGTFSLPAGVGHAVYNKSFNKRESRIQLHDDRFISTAQIFER